MMMRDSDAGRTHSYGDGCQPPHPDVPAAMPSRRECYVGSPAFFLLNHAALIIREAFDSTPYLVGSATERKDWRDVDVRVMLEDEPYNRLFGKDLGNPRTSPLWSLLCATTSQHLSSVTGLPVDFQVQRQERANAKYPKGKRIPLGIYVGPPCPTPSADTHELLWPVVG